MDLRIIGIRDAGSPSERLLLKAVRDCSLYGYVILDNVYDDSGELSNAFRHVFVFPKDEVKKDEYIRVWTKKGQPHISQSTFNMQPAVYHNYYRGFDADMTVWEMKEDTSFLLHVDDSNIPL